MILTQQLAMNSSKYLTRSAFRYLGKEMNFKDLLASISRLSYLYQHELGANVRMAYLCRNSPALLKTFFAMTNIRSVSIIMDPEAPPEEIVKWLKESQATHLAVTSDLLSRARDILQSDHLNLPIIEIEKKNGGEYDVSYSPPPDQTPKDNDIILLLKSSGNTGKPKYCNFSHKQLMHASSATKSHYHTGANDRFHTTLPWSLPFAFVHSLLFPLMAGGTLVIDHGLQTVEFLDFLVESRITRLIATPPFCLKLLMVCRNEKRVLPGIKSITVGMGFLSHELKKTFDLLKVNISHVYGQVENLWTIAMQDTQNPGELPEGYVRGFSGKGIAGLKYKVMDAQGDEVEGKGKRIGQLALAGPTVMQGYMDNEKETKMTIRGTWLYTGDLVRLDGEGEDLTITFICRKIDLIEMNGAPVQLNQVDIVLKKNPMAQDGAAFTVKNAKNHMIIVCAVVKKAGFAINEKQVIDFCAANLPSALVPKNVAFTDAIPRDIGNNVICNKLRGQFSGIGG
jgi:long-chain acyl-CoA synthetase